MNPSRSSTEHGDAIAQVERRIELRRARMVRHAAEARDALRERAKPLPLLGVVAVGVAALVLGRSGGRGAPSNTARSAAGVAAKSGVAAALIALLQNALRLGTSPLVRAGWSMYARRRA
jgi:hypothetical protein